MSTRVDEKSERVVRWLAIAPLLAFVALIGCADETRPSPPKLVNVASASAAEAQFLNGYAMPSCGFLESSHACSENELAPSIYVEIEDTYFASWLEYLRAWRQYEIDIGDLGPTGKTDLRLNVQFELGSRPGKLYEGSATITVPEKFANWLWTDGTNARIYYPVFWFLGVVPGLARCNMAQMHCVQGSETLSLRGAYFEGRSPTTSGRMFFPDVAQIDTTWVTVQHLQPPP